MRKIFLLFLISFFCAQSATAYEPEVEVVPGKENRYNSSISVQFGINGMSRNSQSYGLQFIPPDMSYSRELFDNDVVNISTATFYDNIGVKENGVNYSYRVGQRLDFGLELGKYTPYVTLGAGVMRYTHRYQTSPVYGIGFLKRMSKRVFFVNEINFQHVKYRDTSGDIVNLSVGIVYAL